MLFLPKRYFEGKITATQRKAFVRAAEADWESLAKIKIAFKTSSDAMIHWAPIAEKLRKLDEGIALNFIHFRWMSVPLDVKGLVNTEAVVQY